MVRTAAHLCPRPVRPLLIAGLMLCALGAPQVPVPAAHGAPPAPLTRTGGTTAALVVAAAHDIPAALLTPANERALGLAFHNTVGHGNARHTAPLPVLLLGSHTAPTVRAVLAAIKRTHPVRLYLLGMTHAARLTLVTNTLFDGLTVAINRKPGRLTSLSALEAALARAVRFVPVIQRHGTGVQLANAAQVAATTPITPSPGPTYAAYELPTNLLPPVGDQGQESSCVGWSTSYYYRTVLAAQKYHWSAEDPNHEFSPSFIYNQINGGKDAGSYISDALSLLTQTGDVPISLFPYQAGDYLRQPPGQLVASATAFHIADFGYLYNRVAQQTVPDLRVLKRWLSGGQGLVIGIQVPSTSFSNYTGGVYDGPYASDADFGGHAMFVIGYDDNAEGTGIGAFRVINSWGAGWGEQGYGWLSYDFLSHYLTDSWVMFDTANAPATPTPSAPQPAPTIAPPPPPAPTPAPIQSLLYAATGRYALRPHAAGHDFIATLTFTFSATNGSGVVVEQHQAVYTVAVAPSSDTVYTLRYSMRDGTVATAQVEVQAGAYSG